ncbi:FAD/NAD(P)-binding domain-containing protein [Mollisia scopiformis]|uniref:FAD/NAD(P)-binding domain-containing protein n=1 Tax=Mollisia scopiformis TaxID=149040 RepID=A0A132B5R5_MOLSC|nr:FAD/NAD(P)-binding domain-containing protein [Mollisia scopiformis]KUJ07593.1 FAD/NAD(P)-binding domain-containing protein [Mollisia scopiformis]
MTVSRYLVVIGGSYVGVNVAQQLATKFHSSFKVLLIEKNSHFQHLFAFPRFAVTNAVETPRAFIPYVPGTFAACPPGSGTVVQARVTGLDRSTVKLDRKVALDGQRLESIPYSFLVIATGTKLTPPFSLPGSEKLDGVTYLKKHAEKVIRSSKIVVIGGGAVGVQAATDIKELYPEKSVTLVHSRKTVMNRFHTKLHDIIEERCNELGIELKLGSRVKLPHEGYPTDGSIFNVELEDGTAIPADFALICIGQVPQSSLLRDLSPESLDAGGYIRVLKTLQINNPDYPNVFAVGDVADTGAHKAARPGGKQAAIVANNIEHILNEQPLEDYEVTDSPAIHMSLGIEKNVVFGNPAPGSAEPMIKPRTDGTLDMNINGVWTRRGGGADALL